MDIFDTNEEVSQETQSLETDVDVEVEDSKVKLSIDDVKIDIGGNPRNFRNYPEVENFYRFINDNNLRHEAKVLMSLVFNKLHKAAKRKGRKPTLQ